MGKKIVYITFQSSNWTEESFTRGLKLAEFEVIYIRRLVLRPGQCVKNQNVLVQSLLIRKIMPVNWIYSLWREHADIPSVIMEQSIFYESLR